jgi:hypothetical protein
MVQWCVDDEVVKAHKPTAYLCLFGALILLAEMRNAYVKLEENSHSLL